MGIFALPFLIATLATPPQQSSTTVKHLGNSCQVCEKSGDVEVCKYYKKCPVKKEKKK